MSGNFCLDCYQYYYIKKAFSKKFDIWPNAGSATCALGDKFASL